MSLRFALTTLVATLGSIGPASAAVLPIIGVYGNAAGCQTYYSGNFDNDEFQFLTPDTFSSYGSGCDFAELVSASDDTLVVSGLCFGEGEEGSQTGTVTITGSADTGLYVELEGLDKLGPLSLCTPKPSGVLI
ncbi:MAG: hypothetical protein ACOH2N_05635 [Devosia sp.]